MKLIKLKDLLNEKVNPLMLASLGGELIYFIPKGKKLKKPDAFGRTHSDLTVVKINDKGIKYFIPKNNFSSKQIKSFKDSYERLKKQANK